MLTALNKLDAGDSEEILLSSRDGKDLLVVSYADVQRWVVVYICVVYVSMSTMLFAEDLYVYTIPGIWLC